MIGAMKALRFVIPPLLLSTLFVACGDHPGGSVGDICQTAGETVECEDNEICDTLDDFGPYCLRQCSEHEDCEGGEQCNGVSGSNIKGCHPAEIE